QGWIVHDCLSQLEPLFHTGGVFFEATIASVFELEVGQHFMSAPLRFESRHAVKFPGQGDILGAAKTGNESIRLRHVADGAPEGTVAVTERLTEDLSGAG